MIIDTATPRWAVPFIPPRRYKGVKGGRSGGKSHRLVEHAVSLAASKPDFKVACIREIQKSIRFSIKALVEAKIRSLGVAHLFDIQDKVIKHKYGSGIFIFEGMQDHTADSIKGLEDFDLALVDEANQLSLYSLTLLTPTLRKQGSEIWFAWNPDDEDAPVDTFFRDNEGDVDFLLAHVNITDNPFISDTGWREYIRAKKLAQKKAAKNDLNALLTFRHIWHGEYDIRADKFVFRNWRSGELTPDENVVWFYGVDWGFSVDATAALRCCIMGETLYIDSEAYEVGVPMEGLPKLLQEVTDLHKWPSTADNARPETIDYCRRHGLRRMRAAHKGKGSIEDGITFLQGFDVVINPRCPNVLNEFKKYAYKTDKRTGDILPVVEDKHNHLIDALRYAVEGCHRKGKIIDEVVRPTETKRRYRGRNNEGSNWKTM